MPVLLIHIYLSAVNTGRIIIQTLTLPVLVFINARRLSECDRKKQHTDSSRQNQNVSNTLHVETPNRFMVARLTTVY